MFNTRPAVPFMYIHFLVLLLNAIKLTCITHLFSLQSMISLHELNVIFMRTITII